MTAMAMQIPKGEIVETADHRVLMHGISWEHYELLLEMRGERPQPRMSYLDGELELMTTSEDHERITNWIARLAEVYMEDRGMAFGAYGHYTMKQRAALAGAEADQCYRVGRDQTKGRPPDLAIEVVWTRGGLDKLEIYRRLKVREVWFWDSDEISVHGLDGRAYVAARASAVIPGVDLEHLATFIEEPVMSDAMQKYRAALQSRRA
jgi:Uma2 family endonuclease